MKIEKFYITTPIYYINDVPHIGHAYTTVACDVLARYHRSRGDEVFFLTGTDEHGAKIAEAAAKSGKSPKEFIEDLRPTFIEAWKKLNISNDEFFYTSNPEHETRVQSFVQILIDKGFVEKRKYSGLYCVGCERFYKENELVDGLCPDHKKAPIKHEEENYFFKLSAMSDKLSAVIESGELEVGPESRKNEVIGKIKQGLEDVSISRAGVDWGISFPGDESQTVYVWVDALLNYYTACEIYGKDFWPAQLHMVGKDILWFHAIIWPAMLMAADLPIPKKVFAHGFFTIGGQKMGKSLGNAIDPIEMVEKYGVDAIRYALLREFPFGEDGDFSIEKIDLSYAKLANNIGNLFQRVISMINKYQVACSKYQEVGAKPSVIPAQAGIHKIQEITPPNLPLKGRGGNEPEDDKQLDISVELDNLQFMEALKKIDEYAAELNQFIAEKQPWTLAKEGKNDEVATVLNEAYTKLFPLANALAPFMPETAEKMNKQLESLEPEVLFPRLDTTA